MVTKIYTFFSNNSHFDHDLIFEWIDKYNLIYQEELYTPQMEYLFTFSSVFVNKAYDARKGFIFTEKHIHIPPRLFNDRLVQLFSKDYALLFKLEFTDISFRVEDIIAI
jgi:hypothetical protein